MRTHLAAAGVRSSGAGLEVVPFSSPVVAVGRFEIWVRDIDRQLMSAIVHDVETAMVALRQHGKAGTGPWRSAFLHAGTAEAAVGGITKASIGVQPRSDGIPSSNQPTAEESPAGERSQPSVQARLLARSAHWTAAVEASLSGTALGLSPPQLGSGSGGRSGGSGRGGETGDALRKPEHSLQEILSSVLRQVESWAEELCQPGGVIAYNSVATTALTTQALQQRDVLEELLKTAPPATSGPVVYTTTTAMAGDTQSSLPAASPTTSSLSKGEGGENAGVAETASFSPFLWTCHLRHYYTPPEEALVRNGRAHQSSRRDKDQEQEPPPPPPPLIRVGIGPWSVPYGFEYAGTLERLWLTPLSERCLLHAVHSAKVKSLGLLVGANRSRSQDKTVHGTYITTTATQEGSTSLSHRPGRLYNGLTRSWPLPGFAYFHGCKIPFMFYQRGQGLCQAYHATLFLALHCGQGITTSGEPNRLTITLLLCLFPIQSQGRHGGLLVSASGSHRRAHGGGSGVPTPSSRSPTDITTVAQDVAVAFGRPFRLLHSGCVTSPQVSLVAGQ